MNQTLKWENLVYPPLKSRQQFFSFFNVFTIRDHVEWTKEDQEAARQRAEENSSIQLPLTEQGYKHVST